MNKIIQELNAERAGAKFPDFGPGDTIIVQVKVVEGDRERTEFSVALVIAAAGERLRERRPGQRRPRTQDGEQECLHQILDPFK